MQKNRVCTGFILEFLPDFTQNCTIFPPLKTPTYPPDPISKTVLFPHDLSISNMIDYIKLKQARVNNKSHYQEQKITKNYVCFRKQNYCNVFINIKMK